MIKLTIKQDYYNDGVVSFPGVNAKFNLGNEDTSWDKVLEAFLYALKYSGYIYDVDKIMSHVHEYMKEDKIGPYFMDDR